MWSFIFCTQHQILLGRSNEGLWVRGACGTHGRGEQYVQGFGGKTAGKRPLGRPRLRGEYGIKMELKEIGWGVWSGFTWLSTVIVVGFF
jgi:hypothetical protein